LLRCARNDGDEAIYRAPSEDPDGFPFDSIAQTRMKAIARRKVDRSVEAVFQDR